MYRLFMYRCNVAIDMHIDYIILSPVGKPSELICKV